MTRPCTFAEVYDYMEETGRDLELFPGIDMSDFAYRLQHGVWEDPEDQLDDVVLTAHCHKVMGEWIDLKKDYELSLEDYL